MGFHFFRLASVKSATLFSGPSQGALMRCFVPDRYVANAIALMLSD
jgi:hypothetical protein